MKIHLTTHYLDGFLEALSDPPILREAKALASKLSRMEISIREGEKIAGRYTYEPFDFHWGSGVFCHDRNLREGDEGLSRQEIASFQEKVRPARPYATRPYLFATLTEHEHQSQDAGLLISTGCGSHMAFDHRRLLKMGLPGLADEVERCSRKHAGDAEKPPFFEAMRLALDAVKTFIFRHAVKAGEMAQEASGEERERLLRIAYDCRHLCEEPPRTFRQALQLLWFLHILNDYDSFGRFDRALEEFYKADLQNGILTREEAAGLLEDVWLKITGIQNMTVGGLGPEGEDVSSDLTLLCLEVTAKLGRAEPNLCLRIHPGTPEPVWEAAVQCIGRGTGTPALYSDEIIIPALVDLGIPLEEARDFALAGCSQVVIPGRSNFGCDDGVFSAVKCLELALHDGIDPLTKNRLGPATGRAESFKTFDQVMKAYRAQVEAAAELHWRVLDKTDVRRGEFCGFPLRSLLTEDCLESGLNIWHGGARYNAIQSECVGITNAADSLVVLKKLVFEEKCATLSEMTDILSRDWEGHESLRRKALAVPPKFGNDDEEADAMAAWVSKLVWEEIRRYRCARGNGPIIPGEIVFTYHYDYGRRT